MFLDLCSHASQSDSNTCHVRKCAYRLSCKRAVLLSHLSSSFNAVAVKHQFIGSADVPIGFELALDHVNQLWVLFSSIQYRRCDNTALYVIQIGFAQLTAAACKVQDIVYELQN